MSRNICGKPHRASRFLCLKCMQMNPVGDGIQRIQRSREKYHIKDLTCIFCGERTKNMEIRFVDVQEEIQAKANEEREKYYPTV